jgi:hydrogenase maturation protein HypF
MRLREERTGGDAQPGVPVRLRIGVEGIVQGVGFRPFVHGVATRLGLAGFVTNDPGGVVVEIEGDGGTVARFIETLSRDAPPLAWIERLMRTPLPAAGERGFAIRASRLTGVRHVPVSPDMATCAECLRELFDPADRRHRHPFVNCTHCGPRFTIVRGVPATAARRWRTSCADCARGTRIRAASCPAQSSVPPVADALLDRQLQRRAAPAIPDGAVALRTGGVIAVRLPSRRRDRRRAAGRPAGPQKAPGQAVRRHGGRPGGVPVEVGATAARVLTGATLIVLLPRHAAHRWPDVAPGTVVGVMPPYTALHHCSAATSGARADQRRRLDEPIAHEDRDALDRLASMPISFLTHEGYSYPPTIRWCACSAATDAHPALAQFAPQPIVLGLEARRPIPPAAG